jgi:hypothetical protein
MKKLFPQPVVKKLKNAAEEAAEKPSKTRIRKEDSD